MGKIVRSQDFWSGVLFMVFGAGFLYLSFSYALGDARRMGPGYFPAFLSGLLLCVGLGIAVRSAWSRLESVTLPEWRPLLVVLGSTVLFALSASGLGMLASVFLLWLTSAAASRDSTILASLIGSAVTAMFCWLVFGYALGLPLPAIGPWLGG